MRRKKGAREKRGARPGRGDERPGRRRKEEEDGTDGATGRHWSQAVETPTGMHGETARRSAQNERRRTRVMRLDGFTAPSRLPPKGPKVILGWEPGRGVRPSNRQQALLRERLHNRRGESDLTKQLPTCPIWLNSECDRISVQANLSSCCAELLHKIAEPSELLRRVAGLSKLLRRAAGLSELLRGVAGQSELLRGVAGLEQLLRRAVGPSGLLRRVAGLLELLRRAAGLSELLRGVAGPSE